MDVKVLVRVVSARVLQNGLISLRAKTTKPPTKNFTIHRDPSEFPASPSLLTDLLGYTFVHTVDDKQVDPKNVSRRRRKRALADLHKHNLDVETGSRRGHRYKAEKPNGIACPVCGEEMFDGPLSDLVILEGRTTGKLRVKTHCKSCQHTSIRLF